jgi:hypothetical protein
LQSSRRQNPLQHSLVFPLVTTAPSGAILS